MEENQTEIKVDKSVAENAEKETIAKPQKATKKPTKKVAVKHKAMEEVSSQEPSLLIIAGGNFDYENVDLEGAINSIGKSIDRVNHQKLSDFSGEFDIPDLEPTNFW